MAVDKFGPNVRRLAMEFLSVEAIPHGTPDGQGLATGIAFLMSGKIGEAFKRGLANAHEAIEAIRAAKVNGPLPCADDDESIAAVILEKVEQRKRENAEARRRGQEGAK